MAEDDVVASTPVEDPTEEASADLAPLPSGEALGRFVRQAS